MAAEHVIQVVDSTLPFQNTGAAVQKQELLQPFEQEVLRPISKGLTHMNRNKFLGTRPAAANNDQLISGVLAVMNGVPSVRLTNSPSPYVTHPPAAVRLVLHLLNCDDVRTPEIQDVAVDLARPSSRRARHVRSLSPDAPGAERTLNWKGDHTISFRSGTHSGEEEW